MNIAANSFIKFYSSSIGKKVIVALTGLALIGFLLGHMVGNLKIFAGPEKINSYAAWLHSMPLVLWGARIGLLACFFGHIFNAKIKFHAKTYYFMWFQLSSHKML